MSTIRIIFAASVETTLGTMFEVFMKMSLRLYETSRERPKSAPYLRLKKTRKRKPLFLQLETTKALKELKIEKKKFRIFF